MAGVVEKIFITPKGGAKMEAVDQAEALAGCGLRGDRYCERTGYWTATDECQITFIEAETLEQIVSTLGIRVQNGEHRRNVVTRGIMLDSLAGKKFRVGGALFEFDRPRPPCGYIESITEPGMTRALIGRGGICARVLESGMIRPNDGIEVL